METNMNKMIEMRAELESLRGNWNDAQDRCDGLEKERGAMFSTLTMFEEMLKELSRWITDTESLEEDISLPRVSDDGSHHNEVLAQFDIAKMKVMETHRENVKRIKNLEDQIQKHEALKENFSGDTEKYVSKDEHDSVVAQLEKELDEYLGDIQKLQEQLDDAENEQDAHAEAQTTIETLKETISNHEAKITELQEELNGNSGTCKVEDHSNLISQIADLKEQLEAAEREVHSNIESQSVIAALKEQIKQNEAKVVDLQQELDEVSVTCQVEEHVDLVTQIGKLKEELENAKQEENSIPEAQSMIADLNEQIKVNEAKVLELQQELDEVTGTCQIEEHAKLQIQVTALKEELSTFKSNDSPRRYSILDEDSSSGKDSKRSSIQSVSGEREVNALKDALTLALRKRQKMKKEAETLKSSLSEAESKCTELQSKLDEMNESIINLEEEKLFLAQENDILRSKVTNLNNSEGVSSDMGSVLKEEVELLEATKEKLKVDISNRDKDIEQLQEEVEDLKLQLKEAMDQLEDEGDHLEEVTVLKEEHKLLEDKYAQLNERFQQTADELEKELKRNEKAKVLLEDKVRDAVSNDKSCKSILSVCSLTILTYIRILAELDSVKKSFETSRQEVEKLLQEREVQTHEHQSEVDKLHKSIHELESKLEQLELANRDDSAKEILLKDVEKYKSDVLMLEEQLKSHDQERADCIRQIQDLKLANSETVEKIEALEDTLRKLTEEREEWTQKLEDAEAMHGDYKNSMEDMVASLNSEIEKLKKELDNGKIV
jgi:chromosome segregation ATPase